MDQEPPADDPPIPQYQTPPPGYSAMAPVPGMTAVHYPEESQAITALVLSVVGLVVCGGILCPVGWYLANKDLEAIGAGRRDPAKKDTAQAAKIIGIIGTALVVLAMVAVIGFIALAVVLGTTT